ncbi:MAG: hypothetical protein ACI9WU_000846 [Myxococcota bacterium]
MLRGISIVLLLLLLYRPAEARRSWSQCIVSERPVDRGVLLSAFTTRFSSRHVRRAANVRLSARAMDGVTIPPGGLFSYNKIVGPRSEAAGFRLAPAIDRGKKVDRWGGGVCQPSSTLYAAALLGGMTIVDRRPHTWQSKYIAKGLDATVVWGRKDLVLRNPWNFPVRLSVEVAETQITVRLIGERPREGWVTVQTRQTKQHEFETDVEVDSELGPNDMLVMITGIPGARVERSRTFHRPGKPPAREPLPSDTYYPRDALVRIGEGTPDVPVSRAAQ